MHRNNYIISGAHLFIALIAIIIAMIMILRYWYLLYYVYKYAQAVNYSKATFFEHSLS